MPLYEEYIAFILFYMWFIYRDPRIKYHLQYWGYKIFMSVSVNDEIKIFGVIKDAENAWDG